MKLLDIAERLELKNLTPALSLARDIRNGYVSDILSDVIVHAREGGLLVTYQVHMYAVAVAVQSGFDGMIFSLGRVPEPEVIERAVSENICLFMSQQPSFDIVGGLYALGLRAGRKRA